MPSHKTHIPIAIVVLLLAALACDTVMARKTSGGESINTCDLTSSLQYKTGQVSRKTETRGNQPGNRLCEYSLTLTNANTDDEIALMLYVHHADPYQHLDEHAWRQYPSVPPGGSQEFHGNVTVYADKDVNGRPGVNIAERVVGLKLDYGDCWALKTDLEFLERHAGRLPDPDCALPSALLLPHGLVALESPLR